MTIETPIYPPSREVLGRYVRNVWLAWALEQANPKPSWVASWEAISDREREVDMRIGEQLYDLGYRSGKSDDGKGRWMKHKPEYVYCPDPDYCCEVWGPISIVCYWCKEKWPCSVKRSHHSESQNKKIMRWVQQRIMKGKYIA